MDIFNLPTLNDYNKKEIQALRSLGWLPGEYSSRSCYSCGGEIIGAKHSYRCHTCAEKLMPARLAELRAMEAQEALAEMYRKGMGIE